MNDTQEYLNAPIETLRVIRGVGYLVTGSTALMYYQKGKSVYKVSPHGCSCPSWPKPCKHMKDAAMLTVEIELIALVVPTDRLKAFKLLDKRLHMGGL